MSVLLRLIIVCLMCQYVYAKDTYPQKELTIVVGFGKGGSTDTLARTMAPYLEKELGQPVKIINISGGGSSLAVQYLLSAGHEGYTILCSTFSPYLPLAMLKGKAFFTMDDLAVMNIQWYDYDLVASYLESGITSLPQLLATMKEPQSKLRVAVMENSSGYLVLRFLMQQMEIPLANIDLQIFNSGAKARNSVINGDVDVIIISAEQTELNRENIYPLAINTDGRQDQWDVSTVNEVLPFHVPMIPGSMRGFAMSRIFQKKYPERYQILEDAFKRVLGKKEVQQALHKNKVGGTWTGEKRSRQILKRTMGIFKQYESLLQE